jgi:sugar-specific transcriptional regulator TrmB
MPPEEIVDQLRRIGMSGYEAKVYLAMIAAGEPLNGYELAKRSGVPRSTVYETIAKLVARGSAFEVNVAEGTAYLPLPVESLLARLRREVDESIDALAASLPGVAAPRAAHLIQQVRGHQQVMDRALDVIHGARTDLLVSIWPQEVPALVEELRQAVKRRVDVMSIVFGGADALLDTGMVFEHRFSSPEVVIDRLGCRLFAVVADRTSVLTAGAVGDEMWGMWCDDPAMALVVAEYIRHDMAIQSIFQRDRSKALRDTWLRSPELERLRAAVGSPGLAAFGAGPESPNGAVKRKGRTPG